jgi:hypothetical protein
LGKILFSAPQLPVQRTELDRLTELGSKPLAHGVSGQKETPLGFSADMRKTQKVESIRFALKQTSMLFLTRRWTQANVWIILSRPH